MDASCGSASTVDWTTTTISAEVLTLFVESESEYSISTDQGPMHKAHSVDIVFYTTEEYCFPF